MGKSPQAEGELNAEAPVMFSHLLLIHEEASQNPRIRFCQSRCEETSAIEWKCCPRNPPLSLCASGRQNWKYQALLCVVGPGRLSES